MPVEPRDVLRGLYLGGLRDRPETRLETERRYGGAIGAGGMFYVDREVMRRMGLDGERLAHGSHAREIERYRQVRGNCAGPPPPHHTVFFPDIPLPQSPAPPAP